MCGDGLGAVDTSSAPPPKGRGVPHRWPPCPSGPRLRSRLSGLHSFLFCRDTSLRLALRGLRAGRGGRSLEVAASGSSPVGLRQVVAGPHRRSMRSASAPALPLSAHVWLYPQAPGRARARPGPAACICPSLAPQPPATRPPHPPVRHSRCRPTSHAHSPSKSAFLVAVLLFSGLQWLSTRASSSPSLGPSAIRLLAILGCPPYSLPTQSLQPPRFLGHLWAPASAGASCCAQCPFSQMAPPSEAQPRVRLVPGPLLGTRSSPVVFCDPRSAVSCFRHLPSWCHRGLPCPVSHLPL